MWNCSYLPSLGHEEAAINLLEEKADPKIGRSHNDTALIIAAAKSMWNHLRETEILNSVVTDTVNLLFYIVTHLGFEDFIDSLIEGDEEEEVEDTNLINAVGDKGKFESIWSFQKWATICRCRIYSANEICV